jgi:nucleotide-binding universal stress UspA family protein
MVNITMVRMRKTHPDLERPFRAPFVPWIQYIAIVVQLILAIELFQLSPIAWGVTVVWLLVGFLVYRRHGAVQEAMKTEDTVLLEETVSKRDYSVLLPVASEAAARQMARLGALLAAPNHGELFALHVIRVPPQMGVSDGRAFLRQGRPILSEVVRVGDEFDVPVRSMLRLGRDVADSIISVAREREANLLLLGWPGYTHSRGQAFGSIIDLMSHHPPCDLAVIRYRQMDFPESILVPMAGGPHARLALELAITEADAIEARTGDRPQVVGLHLAPEASSDDALEEKRATLVDKLGIAEWPVELRIVRADDIVDGILQEATGFDQIVIGASDEGLLEQSFFGSIPQKISEEALVTVIMVKRHDMVRFGLRRWITSRQSK